MSSTRVLSIVAVIACAVVLSPGARAEAPRDTQEVDRLYLEGVTRYKSGRYKTAIERFEEAYSLYPDPKLLYNIGRCHESRGDLDKALQTYRRTLDHPRTTDVLRRKARRRIDLVKQVKARTPTTPPPPVSGSAAAATMTPAWAATQNQPSGQTRGRAAADQADRQGSGALTWAKWIVGAVGLGLAAAGTTTLLLGVSDQNKVNDVIDATDPGSTAQLTRAEALQMQDDANAKKVIGYSLIGASAAAIIGSAVLFYFDGRQTKERATRRAERLNVSVAYQPGGGTVGLQGTF